jgi:hypothetical protein
MPRGVQLGGTQRGAMEALVHGAWRREARGGAGLGITGLRHDDGATVAWVRGRSALPMSLSFPLFISLTLLSLFADLQQWPLSSLPLPPAARGRASPSPSPRSGGRWSDPVSGCLDLVAGARIQRAGAWIRRVDGSCAGTGAMAAAARGWARRVHEWDRLALSTGFPFLFFYLIYLG